MSSNSWFLPGSTFRPGSMVWASFEALRNYALSVARGGHYDGRANARNQRLIEACRHVVGINPEIAAIVIYTKDVGHHTSGWWKNPDYERCLHLSLSFRSRKGFAPVEFQKDQGLKAARVFFGEHAAKTWFEPAYSQEGKICDVGHYRLFCNRAWKPIIPKGEVYSKDQTPAGWKSFTEVHGLALDDVEAPFLKEGAS